MLREYVKVGTVEKKKYGEVMTPMELVDEDLDVELFWDYHNGVPSEIVIDKSKSIHDKLMELDIKIEYFTVGPKGQILITFFNNDNKIDIHIREDKTTICKVHPDGTIENYVTQDSHILNLNEIIK